MTQLEHELQSVKVELVGMWSLVESQLKKTRTAMVLFDRDLAREVSMKEKRVNAFELKIDRDCENIFALYCPVAIDLRFLLAVLKINTNLERIGDIADGISKYIIEALENFDEDLFAKTEVIKMFDDAISMLADTRISFEKDDTTLARSIFQRDEVLDDINYAAIDRISNSIAEDLTVMHDALYVLSIIRKLERVGDQTKNIAEEIIFFVEAKVLKHHQETQRK